MKNSIAFLNNPLIMPIVAALVVIYHVLFILHVPYALGLSIIVLTVIIRLILYPLTAKQLEASYKMQKVAPHINRLKETHKGDAKRLQEETMKLYKEHGVNPAAGCLPMLIQLPIIWGLYSVLGGVVNLDAKIAMTQINKHLYGFLSGFRLTAPWDATFFGLPLAQSPSHLISHIGPVVLIIPLLTAFFQFIQSKMMLPVQEKQPEDKKKNSQEDFASAFQTQSMYIFPLMIGFLSYSFPIGLSLYWNTFTIFGILQQYKLTGAGSLSTLLPKKQITNGR